MRGKPPAPVCRGPIPADVGHRTDHRLRARVAWHGLAAPRLPQAGRRAPGRIRNQCDCRSENVQLRGAASCAPCKCRLGLDSCPGGPPPASPPSRAGPPDLAHDHRTANPPPEMLGWTGETRIGSGHSEDAYGPSIGECNAGEKEICNEFLSVQSYGRTPTSVPCRAGTRAALHRTSHPWPEAWRGGAVCNDHLRPARQRQDRAPAVGRAPRARRGHRSNQCLIEHDRYRGGGSPKTFGGTVVERHRRGGLGVRPSSSNR